MGQEEGEVPVAATYESVIYKTKTKTKTYIWMQQQQVDDAFMATLNCHIQWRRFALNNIMIKGAILDMIIQIQAMRIYITYWVS